MEIIGILLVGLVVGGLARLALPGRDPLGCLGTMAVGVAGGLIGGLIGRELVGDIEGRGLLGLLFAVIGAVLILLLLRALAGRRRRWRRRF